MSESPVRLELNRTVTGTMGPVLETGWTKNHIRKAGETRADAAEHTTMLFSSGKYQTEILQVNRVKV